MTQWLFDIVFRSLLRYLAEMKGEIMSAISDIAAQITTGLDTITTGLQGI